MDAVFFGLMFEQFQACMSIDMSPTCKTDEHVFENTNIAKDLIRTCYDVHHSDSRGRATIDPIISVS